MIKHLNIENWNDLETQVQKLQNSDVSHFIISDEHIQVYEDMLDAVELKDKTIIVDYTLDGTYLNDCRYFGTQAITFDQWMQNINHYPNVIFHVDTVLQILETYHVDHILDLTLLSLISSESLTDGHVVFDFTAPFSLSAGIWEVLDDFELSPTNQFNINTLAYEAKAAIPFSKTEYQAPDRLRSNEKFLLKTGFKGPHFIYNQIVKRAKQKHVKTSYVYQKKPEKVKDHIVFLGFDYGFRGNSRYLFNHLAKLKCKTPIYFVTNDVKGPNFLEPELKETNELIETAKIVILESYIPDHLQPNGTIIQLWHGTPIKQLFLDSRETHQNSNIYNYRARKYNKWLQQDYVLCDSEAIAPYFRTAFPAHKSKILDWGYPRVRYLLDKLSDQPYISFIGKELQLDPEKPTLLYAPTWQLEEDQSHLLPLSDGLLSKYNVIFKGHVEDTSQRVPEGATLAPSHIETQDLILVADVVLTDYSSIIFDALTLDKTVCQYTPNHETYVKNRGVYSDVMQSLSTVRYSDAKALLNDLISHQMTEIKSMPYTNLDNHSLNRLRQLVDELMSK